MCWLLSGVKNIQAGLCEVQRCPTFSGYCQMVFPLFRLVISGSKPRIFLSPYVSLQSSKAKCFQMIAASLRATVGVVKTIPVLGGAGLFGKPPASREFYTLCFTAALICKPQPHCKDVLGHLWPPSQERNPEQFEITGQGTSGWEERNRLTFPGQMQGEGREGGMLLVLSYRYASYLLLQLPIFPFKVSLHLGEEEQKEISSEILQGGAATCLLHAHASGNAHEDPERHWL